MERNVYSLEEIFSGKIFSIPDYQRGYAWQAEHCMDLLEDLELLPEGFNHYTGTLVFHRNSTEVLDNEGSRYTGYDIVDGQQRITSIVILLQVIQSFFQQGEGFQTFAKGIVKKFLFGTRFSDGNPFYKLTLNADCKDFFKTDILGMPGVTGQTIRSHQRLATAKKTFEIYLRDIQQQKGNDFYDWLIGFYNKLTQRLNFGIYMVDQAAEVGVIFEVMNNRGKDLTELEKVKNYLLYLTTKITVETRQELARSINKTWSDIYMRFMSAGLSTEAENQFLRAHWLMYFDHSRKNWEGSKSIKIAYNLKNYRNRDIELFNDLTCYVNSLNNASIAFADIENPERENAFNSFSNSNEKRSVIFYSTKLLRTKTIASFRPLLMACRLRFANDAMSYLHLVQLIEKFAFRVYNMEGKRADTGQSALFRIGFDLYNEEISYESAIGWIKGLLNNYSSPLIFESFWDFNPLDNHWYRWVALKYFLYEYEEYIAGGDPLTITWNYFTEKPLENSIEHILPQTPDEAYWQAKFSPEDIKTYLHDLGNLCLTYNNSSYKNFDFDRKKGVPGQENPCYANSSLYQERELTQYPAWTPDAVSSRRKKLAEWAKQRWHVDLQAYQEADDIEGVEDPVEEE